MWTDFQTKQVNENALLQQALAMSMDDPTINHEVRDTDMSEAAAEDPELALGEYLCLIILYWTWVDTFSFMLVDDWSGSGIEKNSSTLV